MKERTRFIFSQGAIFFLLVLISQQVLAQETVLIPKPQKINQKTSHSFNLNNSRVWTNETAHNNFTLEQLKKVLSEKAQAKLSTVKTAKKADIILYSASEGAVSIPKNLLPSSEVLQKIGPQGYWLKIDDKIRIIANTSQGLLYGVQTLKQLLKTSEENALFETEIIDWPALEYRGWMDDISRGPIPTLDYVKSVIKTLSEYKLNFINLYTEHTLRNEKFADIAPPDAFTPAEITELEKFAAPYHVSIIGNQQAFGHMEEILKIPFYNNIADTKWNLNPGSPATYKFLETYLGDAAQAYEHPFFNIGADETDGLGSGKAKDLVDSLGMEAVYAMHINKLDGILKKYGKRTMMWGDIAVNHQEIIEQLPKDLIILSWGYDPRDSFDEAIVPFKESGFDFMVAPGVRSWSEIYPNLDVAVKNIANYVRDGKEYGAMGMINTAWDDDGETLFNANWHGMIWGAEMSWNPIINQEEEQASRERQNRREIFEKGVDQFFFGVTGKSSVMKSLNKFAQLREIPVFSSMANASTWSSIYEFYPEEETASIAAANQKMLKEANKLMLELQEKTRQVNTNKTAVRVAALAAQRAAYTAKKNLFILELQKLYNNKEGVNLKLIKQKREELLDELHLLKIAYVQAWQEENRAYWLDENLKKYDAQAQDLLDIETHVFIKAGQAIQPGEMKIELNSLFPLTKLHYSLDGSEPTKDSPVFNGNLSINSNTLVQARGYNDGKAGEISSRFFNVHKALGVTPKIKGSYSTANPAYTAGGPTGLTDGLKGSENFADGRWQGYAGQDVEVVLDLGAPTEVNEISADFYQRLISWIMLPKNVEFHASKDGKNFQKVAQANSPLDEKDQGLIIQEFSSGPLKLKTRFLKVKINSQGMLPEWHTGAGKPGFIFIDEIVVK